MVLQRWDPFVGFGRRHTLFDRRQRGQGLSRFDEQRPASWAVPVDMVEEEDSVVIKASMPGIAPEDIDVTVDDGVVTLKGKSEDEREERNGSYLARERKVGRFYRSVRLPDAVEADKATTDYENGVVSITFPKQESRKPKRLEIKVGKN